ncbi:MAG: hypothetical protein AAGA48_10835 [Myxococcota bacterium]
MQRSLWISALFLVPFGAGCQCGSETGLTFDFPEPDVEVMSDDAPERFGQWASVDTAPDGVQLTMSYFDPDNTAVAYAIGIATADEDGLATVEWRHERIDGYPTSELQDNSDDVGRYTSQRTAPDGTVWVAYHDNTNQQLKVAHRLGPGTWEDPVVIEGTGGEFASMALNPVGRPIIAHIDSDASAVKITRLLEDGWRTDVVYEGRPQDALDEQGNPIVRPAGLLHTRLIAQDGAETIALYNAARQSLVVLEGGGNEFEAREVDRSADVGLWPSLERAGDDVVVAYHDRENEDLKLATRTGGTWSVEVVDEGQLRGADTEVFIRDGDVAIVYFDGFENDARLASRQNGTWALDRIGADDNAVGFHNEVVRAGGRFWAVSYSYTNGVPYVRAL